MVFNLEQWSTKLLKPCIFGFFFSIIHTKPCWISHAASEKAHTASKSELNGSCFICSFSTSSTASFDGKNIFVNSSVFFMFLKLLWFYLCIFPCLYSIPVYTLKESTWPHEKLDSIRTPPAKHRTAYLLCSVGMHGLRMVKQCQLWMCRLFKAFRSYPWGISYCILWPWRQKCILDLASMNWTQCTFLCLADGERWAAWWEMLYILGFLGPFLKGRSSQIGCRNYLW